MRGLRIVVPAGIGIHGMSASRDSAIAWPCAHIAVPSSETSTMVASPVRSRWNSAPIIPPAMVMAPIESPNPGPGGPTTCPYSGRVMPIAMPERFQNASAS